MPLCRDIKIIQSNYTNDGYRITGDYSVSNDKKNYEAYLTLFHLLIIIEHL